jgi:hypothetical protein
MQSVLILTAAAPLAGAASLLYPTAATPRQLAVMEARTAATSGCSWDYDTQRITCDEHQYYNAATAAWEKVSFSTAAFPRPNCGGKVAQKDCHPAHDDYDARTKYEHPDTRLHVPFTYAFNIGEDIKLGDPMIKAQNCSTTYGDDNKPLSTPAAGFQMDSGTDFGCHRIAGSVHMPENVVVGLLDDADPTAGYYFTVKGGDDCRDSKPEDGYQARSLTVAISCSLETEAIGKVPEIEQVLEGSSCLYMIAIDSSHGCPLSCAPAKESFSGGAYPPPCNAPEGRCIMGAPVDITTCPAAHPKYCIGQPKCACNDVGKGFFGPACDQKCPAAGCGAHGHCAYDATLKKAACFCNDGYSGAACGTPAPSREGPTITQ